MPYVAIDTAVLESLIAMAQSHVEDIQTGLEDGTYDPSENTDIEDKERAVSHAESALAGADPVVSIQYLLKVLHPGAVGLIGNHHGQDRCNEACQAISAAKQIPGVAG